MKVYQIRIKLYLLKDIMAQDVQIMLTRFIDKSLFVKENLGKLHNTNTYKNYCIKSEASQLCEERME